MFRRRVALVCILAVSGLYVGFAIMGFVPALADNPLQAKYFQGEYHAGYLRAAIIFRPSFLAFLAYLPLLLVLAHREHKVRYYLLISAGLIAIAGCLNRGEAGLALTAGVGILVAARGGRAVFTAYLAALVLFVIVGTLANYLLNAYFALKTGNYGPEQQLSEVISLGAPDVAESLKFFESFEQQEQYTYGAHLLGGLVPLQSWTLNWIPLARYNPGFWAEGVMLGTDDQEIIRNSGGGGIRIAVPISGYAAFGWLGAVLVSAIAGFITGYLVRFGRDFAGRGSIEQSAIVMAMYIAFVPIMVSPCAVVLQEFVPPLLLAWLLYPFTFKFSIGQTILQSYQMRFDLAASRLRS
jgi:hypothetical protein